MSKGCHLALTFIRGLPTRYRLLLQPIQTIDGAHVRMVDRILVLQMIWERSKVEKHALDSMLSIL